MRKKKDANDMPAPTQTGKDDKDKKARSQKSVTIEPKALADFEEVAEHLDTPVATFLSEILRQYHRSQEFSLLLNRIREEKVN